MDVLNDLFFIKVQNYPMEKYWTRETFFSIENLYHKILWIFKISIVLGFYLKQIREAHNFLQDSATTNLFDVHCAIQGLKKVKYYELSRDMQDRIIEQRRTGLPKN